MRISNKDRAALFSVLKSMNLTIRGKKCTCPSVGHEDRNPSAGAFESDGKWLVKCQSCGWIGDAFDCIAERDGISAKEAWKEHSVDYESKSATSIQGNGTKVSNVTKKDKPKTVYPTLEKLISSLGNKFKCKYQYPHPTTRNFDLVTIRIEPGFDGDPKGFVPASPTNGGWWMKMPEGLRPIFNRKGLLGATIAIVVEGEGCVEALYYAGVKTPATTSPGGSLSPHKADWTPLSGFDVIYLWPDYDKSGTKYMKKVIEMLMQLDNPPKEIRWINPEGLVLPEAGDAVDFLDAIKGSKQDKVNAVQAVLDSSEVTGAAIEFSRKMRAVISGELSTIEWPFKTICMLSQSLQPGTTTIVCGNPGASKSLFMLQAGVHWFNDGVKIAILELEDGREFHIRRVLAQLSREKGITENKWVKDNPDDFLEAEAKHIDFLHSFGARIFEPPTRMMTMDAVGTWIEQQAANGCRIIVVDPITLAEVQRKQWTEDLRLVTRAKAAAEKYGASVVLVTHPKQNDQKPSMHTLAGGAAYSRFAHTIIWIKEHCPDEELKVYNFTPFGPDITDESVNRSLYLVKCRLGAGHGAQIAFDFDVDSLTFKELGLVQGKKRTRYQSQTKPVSNTGVAGKIGASVA